MPESALPARTTLAYAAASLDACAPKLAKARILSTIARASASGRPMQTGLPNHASGAVRPTQLAGLAALSYFDVYRRLGRSPLPLLATARTHPSNASARYLAAITSAPTRLRAGFPLLLRPSRFLRVTDAAPRLGAHGTFAGRRCTEVHCRRIRVVGARRGRQVGSPLRCTGCWSGGTAAPRRT